MSITDVVHATRAALSSDPTQAQARFEAHHDLVGPCEVTVKVGSGHKFTVDEPEALGGGNAAANPVEYALAALGSCQAITYRVWAAQLGVKLDKVEIDIDGDIDLRGFFGLDERARAGFSAVRIHVNLEGPESRSRYAELAAAVTRTLPDVLAPRLRVVFCGINPGLWSAATGHHFARPGNRFWPALFQGGFTPRQFDPAEQSGLLVHGLGITNIAARATARADELTPAEPAAGAGILTEKVRRLRPAWRRRSARLRSTRQAFTSRSAIPRLCCSMPPSTTSMRSRLSSRSSRCCSRERP